MGVEIAQDESITLGLEEWVELRREAGWTGGGGRDVRIRDVVVLSGDVDVDDERLEERVDNRRRSDEIRDGVVDEGDETSSTPRRAIPANNCIARKRRHAGISSKFCLL